MAKRYEVRREGRVVLVFTDEPGTLQSSAAAPRGAAPVKHPFLNARALDAAFENELGMLVRSSQSVDGFIAALKKAGYEVLSA